MASVTLDEWERIEAERSAVEASHVKAVSLAADEAQVARYMNPPADTAYPLEYAYHLLGDVRGKTVLEYGCGDGRNTLLLARRGAKVTAVDISPELIDIARRRLRENNVVANVDFIVGSAHDLPLPDNSIDVVFGMAILHHLDLKSSQREVRRVLRSGGRAVFKEPVRNSKLMRFLRGLIPYRAADVSPFERPLTDQELAAYAEGFSSFHSKAFLLPTTSGINIFRPLRKRFAHPFYRLDAALLRRYPALAGYAAVRVIQVIK